MKRRLDRPAPDYREHRQRWSDLVALARRAVSTQTREDLNALAEKSLSAESCWTMAAPSPDGLVCRMLTRAGFVYGRQTDADKRDRLVPAIELAADLVADLLRETDAPATIPDILRAAAEATPETQRRLPYADN